MGDKRLTLREAIAEYVRDDLSVAIEGFTAFICFAAGHEIIRQRRRNLTLIRMTPDVIYDQMVAAGVARTLVFSYLGNPGVGPLHCLRRAIEKGIPVPLAIEEYSHYGMVGRYLAGASHLPFFPLRSYLGSEMPQVNEQIKMVHSPYGEDVVAVVHIPDRTIRKENLRRLDFGPIRPQVEAAFRLAERGEYFRAMDTNSGAYAAVLGVSEAPAVRTREAGALAAA